MENKMLNTKRKFEKVEAFNISEYTTKSTAFIDNDLIEKDTDTFSLNEFEKIAQVGEGTYGKVYKVKRKYGKKGDEFYALKKLVYEEEKDGFPITALREIKILKDLKHDNIVRLIDLIISKPNSCNKRGNFYLVLEYISHDLSGILDRKIKFTDDNIKYILYQILEGVEYMHNQKNILHRDIKASNILIDSNGKVKIADYGLARYFSNKDFKLKKLYTNKVVTLWYRAPELFFGEYNYREGVDIWAIGILFWQLIIGYAPIRTSSDHEQIEKIIETLGSVDEDEWPEVRNFKKYSQITSEKPKFSSKFEEMTKR